MLFNWFERRVDPYPDTSPSPAPKRFFPFLWAGTEGTRPFIAIMMVLTASIGAFEALLFAMLGRVVDSTRTGSTLRGSNRRGSTQTDSAQPQQPSDSTVTPSVASWSCAETA